MNRAPLPVGARGRGFASAGEEFTRTPTRERDASPRRVRWDAGGSRLGTVVERDARHFDGRIIHLQLPRRLLPINARHRPPQALGDRADIVGKFLRYGFVIECTGYDAATDTVHCTYDAETKSGTPGSDKVKVLKDGWTVSSKDGSDAAHWEHTVAVHEGGIWVLTATDGGKAGLAPFGIVPTPIV